jgi:hypothetical protein
MGQLTSTVSKTDFLDELLKTTTYNPPLWLEHTEKYEGFSSLLTSLQQVFENTATARTKSYIWEAESADFGPFFNNPWTDLLQFPENQAKYVPTFESFSLDEEHVTFEWKRIAVSFESFCFH